MGDVEVVQGIDMAIPLMRVGEKAIVNADPRFAYGSIGLQNEETPTKTIPPSAKVNLKNKIFVELFFRFMHNFCNK